jgi:peptidyl-prolyl cis-trans isomerase D
VEKTIMIEKFRRVRGGMSAKNWVAYVVFGAIIIVFALWGISPDRYRGETGGVAAVVNDTTISLAEYRNRVELYEQNARAQFDRFPESQRASLQREMKRRALEELILSEVMYQAGKKRGLVASDGEVRDRILEIPFLKENGRFQKDRYRLWLQQMGMSTRDFERQMRKDIVNQKLQDLFVTAAAPAREELKRNRSLANQKVNVRYVEINKGDLAKAAFVGDADVARFLTSKKAEVEKYYKDNVVEYTNHDSVKARHILIKVDDKRPDAEASRLAARVRKEVTPENFSKLAAKFSDDPGSKNKGGDLGLFERGRMVPEFETAAFGMEAGQISEPVKSAFGYHIIYVEKKIAKETKSLASVQSEIARKLLVREKEGAIIAELKTKLSSKSELDKVLSRADLKWVETGEFDLSSSTIPKLGESPQLISAILKRGRGGGLIGELLPSQGGGYLIAEVTSWKEAPDTNPDVEGLERMVAYRKSADLMRTFSEDIQMKARIQRNSEIIR